MKKQSMGTVFFLFVFMFAGSTIYAQQAVKYDLLFKGGHVIDPANMVNSTIDVAVAEGKIARV
ncbi:hypothetical protein ACFL1G_09425, partial [Planctomycetota bacterium]